MSMISRIQCALGWHRWDFASESGVTLRRCSNCGRRRRHGPEDDYKAALVLRAGRNGGGAGGF